MKLGVSPKKDKKGRCITHREPSTLESPSERVP